MKTARTSALKGYGRIISPLFLVFLMLIVFGCGKDNFDTAFKKESGKLPPSPGNSGIISATYLSFTLLDVRWQSASDDKTSSNNLQFRVFAATSVFASYDQALAQADELTKGWSVGITSLQTTVVNGNNYNWCNVYVQDEDGNISAYNGIAPVHYINTPPATGSGGNITVASTLPLQATISWDKASDLETLQPVLQYKVFYSLSETTLDTYDHAATMAAEITTGWTYNLSTIDALLPSGNTFWFTVFVMDEQGLISAYTPKQAVVQARTAPVIGSGLSFTSSNTSITVNWMKATDPDGETSQNQLQYRVFYSTSAVALNQSTPPTTGSSVWEITSGWTSDWSSLDPLSLTATGLTKGITYYFNVYVRDLDLMTSTYGVYSFNTNTTLPPQPGNGGALTLTQNRDSVNIMWTAATSSSLVKYRVYYSLLNNIDTYDQAENSHNGIEITNGWTPDLTMINANALSRDTIWHFNVFAIDSNDGISAYTAAAITLPPNAAPTPGSVNPAVLNTSFTASLSWTAATDDYTPAENLQYRVFFSTTDNSSSIYSDFVNPNDTALVPELTIGWTNNITTALTPVLPNDRTTYYCKIFARDLDGLVSTSYPTITLVVPKSIITPGIIQSFANTSASGAVPVWVLTWTSATDQVTQPSLLQYRVYSCSTSPSLLTTVDDTLPTGTGVVEYTLGWTENITTAIIPVNSVTFPIYYNVYVRNAYGDIKAYSMFTYSAYPQPGNAGSITTSTPQPAQQVDLTWTAATDSSTPQSQLQYCIYSSYVATIGTDEASARAKIVTYSAAFAAALSDSNVVLQEAWSTTLVSPTNINHLGVHGQEYYFNIFVKNNNGNISAYVPALGTTKP